MTTQLKSEFDVLRIKNFLEESIDFKDFCSYHRRKFEQDYGNRQPRLDYKALDGTKVSEMVDDLLTTRENLGFLKDLVFYLVSYWLEQGAPEVILETGLHQDLCAAAQKLWPEQRKQAKQAFGWLAEKFDKKGFGPVWKQTMTALADAPSLGPLKSVEALTAHLKRCRELYQSSHAYRKSHQWLDARRDLLELEELQPGYQDVADSVRGLRDEREVARLQRLLDAAGTSFVYDPRLPWAEDYPYQRLRRLGSSITPASSMDQVQKELRRLQEQEKITAEESDRLRSQLGSDEQRLLTDVFLYPVQLSAETARAVEKIFLEKCRLPKPEELSGRVSRDDEALLLLLLGEPDAAAALWEEAQQSHPRDGLLAHCQALLQLAQAHTTDPLVEREKFVESWRRAIAHWAVATADTSSEYWIRWGRERSQAYGRDFVFTSVTHLGSRIRDVLESLLKERRDGAAEGDDLSETRRQLLQELWIEVNAVRLSKILGGIVIGPGRVAWFGPLWMCRFGLEMPLARYLAVAAADDSLGYQLPEGYSLEDILRRLRWYFSSLKKAAVLLEGDAPDPLATLTVLTPGATDDAVEDCGDPLCPCHGPSVFQFAVRCLYDDRFAAENPAYHGFESPGERIREDALCLAAEARWCLVREQIRDGEIRDPEALRREWRELIRLAEQGHHQKRFRDRLSTLVVAETRPRPDPQEQRLTGSIKLLEFSLGALADPHPGALPLKIRLAELLEQRGLSKLRRGNVSGTEGDLKRALAMAPHLHQIRGALASLWSNLATNVYRSDRFLALDYLRQAIQLIESGRKAFPGSGELDELRGWIERSQQNLIHPKPVPGAGGDAPEPNEPASGTWKLPGVDKPTNDRVRFYAKGKRQEREGRLEQALDTFRQGLECFPEDVDLHAAAVDTLLAAAWKLAHEKKHPESLDLIAHWRPLLGARDSRLQRPLEFLERWPQLAPCLENANHKLLYELKDYQELLLPFEARHRASVVVGVEVRGEDLCMSAPFPLLSITETEAGLSNVLRTSRDAFLVKVAAAADSRLVLQVRLPLRLLADLGANWFVPAAFQLKGFVDVSREQLTQSDALKAWFQETRAAFSHDFENPTQPSSSKKRIEKMLKKRKLTLTKDDMIRAAFGLRVKVELPPEGLRLRTDLDPLPASGRHHALRRLVELNAELERTKLVLDDDTVVLSAELPFLEENTMMEALSQIESGAKAVRAELSGREQVNVHER